MQSLKGGVKKVTTDLAAGVCIDRGKLPTIPPFNTARVIWAFALCSKTELAETYAGADQLMPLLPP